MHIHRFILTIAMVLFAGASLAQEGDAIRIGVIGPFTGGSSPMGLSMREGIRIAADQINEAGGVLGRPIVLVERDDEARNELGMQLVQALIESEDIVAGLGIVNTGVALASQRHFQRARIPVITSVATGTLITRQFTPPEYADNFVFRVSANDTLQALMIVFEAIDRRGFERVAIFHDATNYGQLGREDLEKALAARGITAVSVERFQLRQADMMPLLRRAQQAGAQAILTYGIGPELAQIANTRSRMGWNVPIIGSWTLAMSNFIDAAGPNAEGTRMPQSFIAEPTTEKRARFLEAWLQRTGSQRIPVPPAAAQGYDSMLILAAAIEQAGSTDGDRIREALESLEQRIEGVVMTYERPFSRANRESITRTQDIFMGEVRDGRIVFAYESDRERATKQ